MTASWTTEPVFALIFVDCDNHEVQSRRCRDSNPRPSDQGASVLPLDHETSPIYCVLHVWTHVREAGRIPNLSSVMFFTIPYSRYQSKKIQTYF